MAVDFGALDEDHDFLVELPDNVWLMDDHKWALLVWETYRRREPDHRCALLHADFHWDGVDDFHDDEEAQAELLAANLDQLRAMTERDEYIRYDSFIAPAVRRDTLSELHFFCLQDNGGDTGVDVNLCTQHGVPQTLHPDVASFAAVRPVPPLVFDLCLDLFNRSDRYYEGDLWSDDEISEFLEAVKHQVQSAAVVTISLSFSCSGTADDTRRLAALVVPRVLKMRR